MIERLTPVADGGKGPEILRPAGDLASPQAGCSPRISSNRMFEIGSRAPWAGTRPGEQSSTGSPARRRRSQT